MTKPVSDEVMRRYREVRDAPKCLMCGGWAFEYYEDRQCDYCLETERHCWGCMDENKAWEIVKSRDCQVCHESLGLSLCDTCWYDLTERWCDKHQPDFSKLGIGLD